MTRKSGAGPIAPISPRGVLVFDTDIFAPDQRLDAWRAHVATNFATFDFDVSARAPFFGRLETLTLGSLRINRGDCSAAHWVRLSRHLADGHDDYGLCIVLSGRYRVAQGGLDAVRQPGSFTLIDNGRASTVSASASGVDYDIVVPRAALRNTQRVRALSSPPILDVDATAMRLLGTYVDSLYQSQEDFSDPVLAGKIGEHLLDLIVLGLRPTTDAAEQARGRGLRAARLRSILAEIRRRFADPGITPAIIAAGVHISESYLHKLLDEQGLVFTRIVLELRLDRAASLLIDPSNQGLRIGDIARQAGFADVSYFNRCFRAQFGATPGEMRSEARPREA